MAIKIEGSLKIPQKMKAVLVPAGLLLAMIFLGMIIVKVGFGRIKSQRTEMQKAEKNETILSQKQQVLQSLQNNILSYADISLNAIPESNPSLTALSQLKSVAEENGLFLNNIEIGNEVKDKSNTYRAGIAFEVEGSISQILPFLISLKELVPLLVIDRVEIQQTAGVSRASVELAVFWASLPTKLPSISEPVLELSASETNLLNNLSSFRQPIFTQALEAIPTDRENPFTY